MKRVKMKKAFTIVEVILVLSISSLFAVGMMVGWNVNIERQRYNDTVNTLKSDIQGIFNEVENPTNALQGGIACREESTYVSIEKTGDGSVERRGSTNCIIIGKLVTLNDNTHRVIVSDIVGKDIDISRDCKGSCSSHIEALRAAKITFNNDDNDPNRRIMPILWSNRIRFREGEEIGSFIVVRSPLDGTLLAFHYDRGMVGKVSVRGSLGGVRHIFLQPHKIMNDNNKIGVCVDSGGSPFGGRSKLILIGGTAASVEIAPLDGGRRCS